ncbi:Fur family transcriptional regulator [Caminibacter pacificus]|uniref:Fur family ferric uptake transcriptional regulator n=1 Tax=Caminibacter pacificus TaxID=1424653 RepID=A0AAJ4RB28_9BACT|nr:transcriptional repressor [Caminibacter pacificus]NPA88321.1 HTH domain-containing protein [Campylobacterota bacterium]QCI29159.1 HTH domain-containing protein [Caminibacter pacificus]ROR38802.1 Fur family ferric uptake transcriptional regulator [Caminibacter pacificus]
MSCDKIENLKKTELQIALLLNEKGIMSAKELQIKLNVDKATIYRNLKHLLKKHTIREIKNSEGIGFYELNCKIHNPIHPHFECKICKKIYCLKPFNAEDILSLSNYSEYDIEEIEVKFKGICDECKKIKSKK